jgi:hypothetical protein
MHRTARKDPMRNIVINTSNGDHQYGGFSLSHKGWLRLRELGQPEALAEADAAAYWPEAASPREPSLNRCGALVPRDDDKLVQVIRELGEAANGHCAELKIVEIPEDVAWEIECHGGVERVSEKHRSWT